MSLIFFIVLVFLIWIVAYYSGRNISPAVIKPKKPIINKDDLEKKNFNWKLTTVVQNLHFDKIIYFSSQDVGNAKLALLDSDPGKVILHNDHEAFAIINYQINHSEWGFGSDEIEQLVDYINSQRLQYVLSKFETVNLVLSFVQSPSINYKYDEDSTGHIEYFRFPIETLYDQVGDCDCKAILAGAILKKMGFRVALLLMPGHAAIAVNSDEMIPAQNLIFKGVPWYYCETTGNSWTAGKIPEGINWYDINLYEIE